MQDIRPDEIEPYIQTYLLEKLPYHWRHTIDLRVHRGNLPNALDTIVTEVTRHVPAFEVRKLDASYPKTWWGAFKLEYFPQSWLRRWPATMVDKKIRLLAAYPECRRIFPHDEWGDPWMVADVKMTERVPPCETSQ